jgi:inner membrane protein
MTAPTHITFASFVYLLLLTTTGVSLSIGHTALVAVASILPDLDTGSSWISRLAPALALRIERTFGHRTLTHSLLFIAGMAGLLSPVALWDGALYACFIAGYASHPFLDTMTVSGVRLFYPASNVRCVFPLEVNQPFRYRTRTGSRIDRMLGLAFFAGCIPTFLIAEQGYERFIRVTQHNVESAARDYNEFSRTNIVYADITAHSLLTKEHLQGRFEIVGTLNQHTVIFRGPERRLHSLGNEYQAEYVGESARCQKGEPARIVVRRIDLVNQPLSQVLTSLDPALEHQFFGHLSTADHIAVPGDGIDFSPVTGSSGSLKFNFATYDDVRALGLEDVFIDHGTLTVRTIERASATTPSPPGNWPPAAQFARITFQIDEREPVEFRRAEGDTVQARESLARWGRMLTAGSEIELNNARISALEEESAAKTVAFNARVAKAAQEAGADSLGLIAMDELGRRGFVAPPVMKKAEARNRLSHLQLERLQSEGRMAMIRSLLQIRALRVRNDLLELRQQALEARCEARSPCKGVIAGIKRSVHDGKLRAVILIRRE